jgi:hypothetical protein
MSTYTKAARQAFKSTKKTARSYAESLPRIPHIPHAPAARTLGWVSIAIGLTELLAPRRLEEFMGLDGGPQTTGIFRALGVREVTHGVDLLSHADDPALGVYARCAGDVLDSALLGAAMLTSRRKSGVAAIFALVLPVVAADLLFARHLARHREEEEEEDWL